MELATLLQNREKKLDCGLFRYHIVMNMSFMFSLLCGALVSAYVLFKIFILFFIFLSVLLSIYGMLEQNARTKIITNKIHNPF